MVCGGPDGDDYLEVTEAGGKGIVQLYSNGIYMGPKKSATATFFDLGFMNEEGSVVGYLRASYSSSAEQDGTYSHILSDFFINSKTRFDIIATGEIELYSSIDKGIILRTNGEYPNAKITMDGPTIVQTPTEDMNPATKKYVDDKISDKELILTSSTENSTKKFKITVDDTGTLTATEVQS